MKNKVYLVIFLVVLLIPTYVAIWNFALSTGIPSDGKEILKVELTDTTGKVHLLENTDPDSQSLITLLLDINANAKEKSTDVSVFDGKDYLNCVFYTTYNKDYEVKYYLTENPSNCYFVNNEGKTFLMDTNSSATLLKSEYAMSVYETARLPLLTVSNGTKIDPTLADWSYLDYSGSYTSTEGITFPAPDTLSLREGFALSFEDEPDEVTLTIRDADGVTMIENKTLDLNKVSFVEEGTNRYSFKVDAVWYETRQKGNYGKATYTFDADISPAPIFKLGTDSINPGEFVALSAYNVDDISKIGFTSSPSIEYTPRFFALDGVAVALVPVSMNLEKCDKYTFTLSCDGVSSELTLNMKNKTFKAQDYDVADSILASTRTESTLNDFYTSAAEMVKTTESTPLWEGNFLEVSTGTIRTGFGLIRTINKDSKTTYRHDGVDYNASSSTDVIATNSGKVTYVGEYALTGKLIVIDHGLGLKTWYANLSSINVKTGDTVNKGDVIGHPGTTGFTNTSNVHAGMSVFEVPVCPYPLWETGIVIAEK